MADLNIPAGKGRRHKSEPLDIKASTNFDINERDPSRIPSLPRPIASQLLEPQRPTPPRSRATSEQEVDASPSRLPPAPPLYNKKTEERAPNLSELL
jgi:hypothetical protein